MRIREVELDDYRDISQIRKMEGVMENILATPEEPAGRVRNKILNLTEDDFWYVAEDEGQVIGLVMLKRYSNARKKHVGVIGLMVDRNYQGMGIGNLLLEKIINLADNKLNIKRLELNVFIDNERAIKLYEKHGFKIEGTQKYAAIKNDSFTDELMMARVISIEETVKEIVYT